MKLTKKVEDFTITASLSIGQSSRNTAVYFKLVRNGFYMINEVVIKYRPEEGDYVTENSDIGDWESFISAMQDAAEYLEQEAKKIKKREAETERDFQLTLKMMGFNE